MYFNQFLALSCVPEKKYARRRYAEQGIEHYKATLGRRQTEKFSTGLAGEQLKTLQ